MKVLDLATQVKLNSHEASRLHAFAIAKGLQALGNEVTLVVGGDSSLKMEEGGLRIFANKFASLNEDVGFVIKVWRSVTNNFSSIYKLRNVMGAKPDVIYERYSIGSFIGIGLAKLMRRPLVFEVNGVPDEEIILDLSVNNTLISKILFFITKLHLKSADVIIVQSGELENVLKNRFKLKTLNVIPNGAHIPEKPVNLNKYEGTSLCFIGKLDEMHDLTEFMSVISGSQEDFVFRIVGDGKMRLHYEKKFKRDKRFKFLGRLEHEEAMQVLSKSSISLAVYDDNFPLFRKYGFYLSPLKLFEYLAYEKPCLYYGPTNSLLAQLQEKGAILTATNKGQLASNLTMLLHSKQIRQDLIRNARLVSRDYSWEASAAKTEEALRGISST